MFSPAKRGWEFSDSMECLDFHAANASFPGHCNATWDGFLCWPLTQPGRMASQLCPENVKGILRGHLATRKCSQDGFWISEDGSESMDPSWTNFTGCFTTDVAKVLSGYYGVNSSSAEKLYSIAYYTRIFEMVGYSVSFISILASLCILSAFRSLRTREKSIHRQLYLAMLIQVVIRLILYTDQLVSRKGQIDTDHHGSSQEATKGIDNTPYLCESFYVLLEYARTAMFHWFFIEGLHLHNVLTINVFPANGTHCLYFLIGWGIPVLMTLAWAIVTGIHVQAHCWFGYNHTYFYWIVEGPRLALIAVNLLFLLNILRVLLTKLRNNSSSETKKVRKAVKAAIVLQPLLGITNSLQMVATPDSQNMAYFALWSVGTTFLVSFQGFFAALFYCFLNGEVRSVLGKYCETLQTQRDIRRSALISSSTKRRQSSQSTTSRLHLTTHKESAPPTTPLNAQETEVMLNQPDLVKILPKRREYSNSNRRADFELVDIPTTTTTTAEIQLRT